MNHGVFQPIAEELERCHPAAYHYGTAVNQHRVAIFKVRRTGVAGLVEVLAASDSSYDFLSTICFDSGDWPGSQALCNPSSRLNERGNRKNFIVTERRPVHSAP